MISDILTAPLAWDFPRKKRGKKKQKKEKSGKSRKKVFLEISLKIQSSSSFCGKRRNFCLKKNSLLLLAFEPDVCVCVLVVCTCVRALVHRRRRIKEEKKKRKYV